MVDAVGLNEDQGQSLAFLLKAELPGIGKTLRLQLQCLPIAHDGIRLCKTGNAAQLSALG